MPTQTHFGSILSGRDIFLCHTGADKPWVEMLAERIESVPYQDRHLGVIFDKWDFAKGRNVVLEIDDTIDQCRFIGLVVSNAMLQAEWPTMERTIAVWSDPSGRKGRVLPLLIENVDLPPSLRIRNWIDFRDPDRFEESFVELVSRLRNEPIRRGRGGLSIVLPAATPYSPGPVVITGSNGPDRINEQLVTNLLPVTGLPTVFQVAKTQLREKKDIKHFTKREDIPPFILREGCLFTFSDLHDSNNALQAAIDIPSLHDEPFAPWFRHEDHRRWAVELLNLNLREFAWQRYLRFDRKGQRFFFTPKNNGPKTITWQIAGTKHDRHVTTRHYAYHTNEQGEKEKFEYGWRHQALRAHFLHLPNGLFLKLTPTYLLTKDDGKTPRGGKHVGPILSQWLNQERNGQLLRSLRFWSLVLTRGDKKELRIQTGHEAITISLTPANGPISFGINGDTIDYDRLMNAEYEDDLRIPDLERTDPEQLNLTFGETIL